MSISSRVALTYRLDAVLQGWKHLAIVPLALTTSVVVNAAAGWPSWTVINSDLGWVTNLIDRVTKWIPLPGDGENK